MSQAALVADVVDSLCGRGFRFIGRADDGWLRLLGDLNLKTGGAHACHIDLDPQFIGCPRIRLLRIPTDLPHATPHIRAADGLLCYIADGTIVLDIFDPVGQTLACLQRAEDVLESILRGEMIDDLEEEFHAHWNGPLCLLDLQTIHLGKQTTLLIGKKKNPIVVVTDNHARTARKLKARGWDSIEDTMPAYRVRTSVRPRPHSTIWPPKTVRDVLEWQRELDPRCRKNVERRLKEGLASKAGDAIILIESPKMTYGFAVSFDQPVPARPSHQKTSIYSFSITPVSILRIDDRYITQRNIPGMNTLAGKNLAIIGCGTIGGYLAEMLVKAGAGSSGGRLTLVDQEDLLPQNIGRHRLGFPSLLKNKATGMAEELIRLMPDADIRALPVNATEAQLGSIDLLIDATGEEALGHWLCKSYLPLTRMLSVWIEGPGTAVRALLRAGHDAACYRCLREANKRGELRAIVGELPIVMAGQGCEGLYVPFAATASVQAASLAAEMALRWANGCNSPTLRTRIIDEAYQLATPDCNPTRIENCPACHT